MQTEEALSFFNPRSHPSLPQNDTIKEQLKRAEQLGKTKQSYVWTYDLPNLAGVPMSQSVPFHDKPTVAWFIKVIEVVLQVVENMIATAIDEPKGNLKELQSIHQILTNLWHAPTEFVDKDHSSILEQELMKVSQRLGVVFHDQFVSSKSDPPSDLARYQNLFETIELNPVSKAFQQDQIFAYLHVAGPNAKLIRQIPELPANFPVTDEGYRSVMGDSDSLAQALVENRLFVLDYVELQALADHPGQYEGVTKQLFAPLVLLARAAGGVDLVPVAIQRTQTANAPAIVYATTDQSNANYWPWQTAKSIVQMADGNYHELFLHLPGTHLLIEAFAVATHRNLANEHPLNVLLLPHFEGTLFINNVAANGLIAAGSPVDHIFAAVITQSQASAGGARLDYDFYGNMLPNDLAARRVNDAAILPNYPFRDDALSVWNAIYQWAKDYVDIYYVDDNAVVSDTELTAWAADLANAGKVKGFRPITTKDQLAQVLTMIMFTCSAQHASVNFPQSSIMTYSPAISGAIWGPQDPAGANEQEWLATLPPIGLGPEQLGLLHVLGGVYYRMLGNYKNNEFPYLEWFGDKRVIGKGHALDRFQQSLKVVEAEIDQRNSQRSIPYTYLLPSKIPMSINI